MKVRMKVRVRVRGRVRPTLPLAPTGAPPSLLLTAGALAGCSAAAAAAAPQTFVVLKHSWRGTYERLLCLDGAWVRTLHP